MTKERRNRKLVATGISIVLAVALVGGVLALGGCSKNTKIEYSYTPEIGNGKTYYVSADIPRDAAFNDQLVDDDGNPYDCDGSYDHPYNILDLVGYGTSGTHSSQSILEPGDTVLVMPGVYTQTMSLYIEKSGTYDNYITIMNAAYADDGHTYDDTSCTISLYGEDFDGNYRGVTINSDYIYWYGIDVAGAGDNGMYIGGNHNVIENCQFYNNRDTGLQLGRKQSADTNINQWPSYNLIKNCTSFNNYDNQTYGENADGFGAKLTIGYGNIFDGCIAYRNSDDGWDLYAKEDTGNIGCVIIYNCIAFENGYLLETQATANARFGNKYSHTYDETDTNKYTTRDGDGNGFKLGGGSNEGDVKLYNCISFNNRMHGVTDNSNPGTLQLKNVTSYNNCASIDNDSNSETFGQVNYDGGTQDSGCANIDVARQTYSYNTLENVLSVIDGNSQTSTDAYRGAVTNSMFMISGGTSGYYIEDPTDADTKNSGGIVGESYTPSAASGIFVAAPSFDLGTKTEFDENGIVKIAGDDVKNVHVMLHNSSTDWSINAGNILKIKDGASLILDGVGADLSKGSWDEYEHYEYTTGSSSKSQDADDLAAVYNMIYLPVDENAVYQNFKAVNSILGVDIEWSSSDESLLRVTDDVSYTTSMSSTVAVEVNRDPDADREVTLTAKIKIGKLKTEKTYDLVIKRDIPSIGSIIVDGVEDDQIIVDMNEAFPEPLVTVENGSDYNGKILDNNLYTVKTTYEYAENSTATYNEVDSFTTSVSGVYKITLDISINDPDPLAKVTESTYSYLIYVCAQDANVDFVDEVTLTVNRYGYELTGEVSNPTGYSYVLETKSPLTGTGTSGTILPSQVMNAEGVIKQEFRTTDLQLQFDETNDGEYYVYCVLTSIDGSEVTDVYEKKVETTNITTTADFATTLEAADSSTICLLTTDLDFNETSVTVSTFKGFLNGLGHTVKNISTTNAYVFGTIQGGTIENIKFENISINYKEKDATTGEIKTDDKGNQIQGTENNAGLIQQMRGGYLYNIAATNISVISGGQRVGGIVGLITATAGDVYTVTNIQCVSLVNEYHEPTDEEISSAGGSYPYKYAGAIISGSERVGGIIGFIQGGNSGQAWCVVNIRDCYVNAYITGSSGIVSGIVGRSDDRNKNDYLEINACYVIGALESTASKAYIGGMIGQFTGSGTTRIYNCVSYATLWYGGETLTGALKNASWIVGNFASNADMIVSGCVAYAEDYNTDYGVLGGTMQTNRLASWQQYSPLNMEYWEYVYNPDDPNGTDYGDGTYSRLKSPYIQLVFQGDWDNKKST